MTKTEAAARALARDYYERKAKAGKWQGRWSKWSIAEIVDQKWTLFVVPEPSA